MTNQKQRSSRDVLQQFDESVFKPSLENRVELPPDEGAVYEEVQPFDQLWIWILMGLEFVIMLIALLAAQTPWWTIAAGLGVMTITMAVLSSFKLYTRIDTQGVHFRMSPVHFREQHIPWEDIDQIHVRKYSPIMEYGGWGIRFGWNGRAYNVRGNYGIQLLKKNGKRLLIGTQRPEEVARLLASHPLLV